MEVWHRIFNILFNQIKLEFREKGTCATFAWCWKDKEVFVDFKKMYSFYSSLSLGKVGLFFAECCISCNFKEL